MNKYYGFWLLFENDDKSKLKTIIEELSDTYLDGKVFVPHLSIFPSVQIELQELTKIIESNFQKQERFQVYSKGIEYEDRWSKTFYVDIQLNDSLENLNKRLEKVFSEKLESENNYHPHISLMYKEDIETTIKEKLQEQYLKQIPQNLTIKSLGIVDPGVKGDNWRDFSKWEVVREIDFR